MAKARDGHVPDYHAYKRLDPMVRDMKEVCAAILQAWRGNDVAEVADPLDTGAGGGWQWPSYGYPNDCQEISFSRGKAQE